MVEELGKAAGKLRRISIGAVMLVVLAIVIGLAGIGYWVYGTMGYTAITGSLNAGGQAEEYRWTDGPLLLEPLGSASTASCELRPQNGEPHSVPVLPGDVGLTNIDDRFVLRPQNSVPATITCSRNVKVYAGEAEVAKLTRVYSPLFRFGVPAVLALLIVGAILVQTRKGRRKGA